MEQCQSESFSTSASLMEVWDAATLLQHLVEAGEQVPPELRDRILAQGERIVPALITVVEDRSLAESEAPGCGYVPLHAVDLLVELKVSAAIPALLAHVQEYEWQSLLFNRAVFALKSFGGAAYGPILEALRTNDDPEIEPVLVEILAGLGRRDGELYEILAEFARRHPEQGAMALADYGDARAVPLLHELHDGLEVTGDADGVWWSDQPIIEIAGAIGDLGGTLSAAQREKLKLAKGRRREQGTAMRAQVERALGELSSGPQAGRLGRNDPCWCGIGRKYKKCHLHLDREAKP